MAIAHMKKTMHSIYPIFRIAHFKISTHTAQVCKQTARKRRFGRVVSLKRHPMNSEGYMGSRKYRWCISKHATFSHSQEFAVPELHIATLHDWVLA